MRDNAQTTIGSNTTDQAEPDVIIHTDMDCFYASCERRREPALADKPVVVGMGYETGETNGAVATASYDAREYGIESAQPISEAISHLLPERQTDENRPTAAYRPVDMDYYESVSEEVMTILTDVADTIRKVSIDEAYLDVTDVISWDDDVRDFAHNIKQQIANTVGVPVSVGVAPNMSAAKIASDKDKPDGLVIVKPDAVAEFIEPLPVEDIHGIGPVTADRLHELGITTGGELAAASQEMLTEEFGQRGEEIYQRANGIDPREVTETDKPKSLNRESAFTEPVTDTDTKHTRVTELATDVAHRADQHNAGYQTIGIKVVTPPYNINTRERSLSGPVHDPETVTNIASDLLTEFDSAPVRKVGVFVTNFSFGGGDQLQLQDIESNAQQKTGMSKHRSARDSDDKTDETNNTADPQTALTEF